jgi:hypothetical protein
MALSLPFQCPDLVMPISGRLSSQRHSQDGFEFTALSALEKKLLLGLKLLLCDDIGLETDQWIVWMAHQDEFILHMWRPVTGELRQINLRNASVWSDSDGVTVKHIRVTSSGSSSTLVIVNDGYPFMEELYQLLQAATDPCMPCLPPTSSGH